MGYPETGHVTEIVPPSTDFTDGMGRTRGGPASKREREKMRWRLLLGGKREVQGSAKRWVPGCVNTAGSVVGKEQVQNSPNLGPAI